MKVLNISRYLPIKGFPAMNDITLKIYAELRDQYGVTSLFIMPLSHIPKGATYIKASLKKRYQIIHQENYIDKTYKLPIRFFQGYFPFLLRKKGNRQFYNLKNQFPFYKKSLFKQVKSFHPDLVHAHTIDDAFYAHKIFLEFGTPYIVTLRGFYHDLYKTDLIKEVFHKAEKLITPSARLKLDLKHLYDVELIPHGVDKEWYVHAGKKLDTKTLRLITVASLIEMKNIQTVIKSVAQLINEGHKIQYSIIGEGEYRNTLENLVKQEKIESAVKFYGFLDQEEIRQVYKNHDVFIMLSYPETFGRVYFEAAAQGLLLIGREATGMDGYFNKEEAFVCDGSVKETTKILKKIDKNVFKSKVDKSRKKIKDFENDQIIQRYYQIIKSSC